jgi:hypothetical protein
MTKSVLKALVRGALLAVSLLVSSGASAAEFDGTTFIHMQCQPETKSAVIRIYQVDKEAGLELINHPQPDTYYLHDIANSQDDVTCDLGGKQTISFIAREEEDRPRNNNLTIFLNKFATYAYYTLDPQVITAKWVEGDTYDVEDCQSEGSRDKGCRKLHMVEGHPVEARKK